MINKPKNIEKKLDETKSKPKETTKLIRVNENLHTELRNLAKVLKTDVNELLNKMLINYKQEIKKIGENG